MAYQPLYRDIISSLATIVRRYINEIIKFNRRYFMVTNKYYIYAKS